jgi:hypothetical protein
MFKLPTFFLTSCLFLGTSALAQDEVSLLSSMNVPMSKYGMSWQSVQLRLRVADTVDASSVRLIFVDGEGTSTTVDAALVGPADRGHTLWDASINLQHHQPTNFHVEYTVGGQIQRGLAAELKHGPILYAGQNIQEVQPRTGFYGNYAYFSVALRNLAYHKQVQAHYSCDNFQSKSVAALGFQPFYTYGYGVIHSPTPEGFEMWSTGSIEVPEHCHTIRYYYTYEVDGQQFADINFWHNYVMYRN